MSSQYRIINVVDTVSGLDTTIKVSRVRFPDELIVYPREKEDIIIHQINGTYRTIEDFNYEWDQKPESIEKKVLCSRCKEPITYYIPDQKDLVNFLSLTKTDARRLINALIGVLQE